MLAKDFVVRIGTEVSAVHQLPVGSAIREARSVITYSAESKKNSSLSTHVTRLETDLPGTQPIRQPVQRP
ncbi:hypothetical protein SAMN04488556_3992 [Halostagnicola kamekurae]|uniref:Uncharacterized protein n=1 Tax=Halostagnicola kamekurae TaxID=619731 RepID=A0A1I6UPN4_9EURY|nr:hypothetical protein SAMN04488556_3992 [Halostagnicola kamekurae]